MDHTPRIYYCVWNKYNKLEYLINYCKHKLHSSAQYQKQYMTMNTASELTALTLGIEAIIFLFMAWSLHIILLHPCSIPFSGQLLVLLVPCLVDECRIKLREQLVMDKEYKT